MIPDVLVVSVPVIGPYASVNTLGANGHRAGKKTEAYKRLFAAVKEAASAEMERTGWTTVSDFCDVTVTRYVPDHRRRDSGNLAKCELDSLTQACVWEDDSQALRVGLEIVYDAGGPDRVVIIVRRMYQEVSRPIPRALAKEILASGIRRKPSAATVLGERCKSEPVKQNPGSSEPTAILNGRKISVKEALQTVRGER